MATQNTQNLDTMMRDMMNAFPVNAEGMQDGFKRSAEFNEKMAHIAMDFAGQSTDVTADFTRKTLERMSELTKAKDEPQAYAQSVAEFGQKQTEATMQMMQKFAEIAQSTQTAAADVMASFGKEAQEQAASTAKKTASNAQKAASDATSK